MKKAATKKRTTKALLDSQAAEPTPPSEPSAHDVEKGTKSVPKRKASKDNLPTKSKAKKANICVEKKELTRLTTCLQECR